MGIAAKLLTALSFLAALSLGITAHSQDADDVHHHRGLDVDVNDPEEVLDLGAEGPGLSVEIVRATDGGWNLDLTLANFEMLADGAVANPALGSGHIHLYLGGELAAQIKDTLYHLDPLDDGVHEIAVGLVSEDGRFFARDGEVALRRFVVLEARSDRDADAARKEFDIDVRDGVEADTIRVTRDDLVMLRWTVDAPMELHFHGYDVEAEISPSSPATMVFNAEIAGRFPVEAHTEGGDERVVLFVEVLP